ncbi:autotransporter domain-containing protein [Castellaniella hirudinis]|uniref:autotransporter outer membrane beta-barrel domain-containing protein n=1 Tax=Castellaniella hirudinis TaxID=1144617 RepID=UPI0039C03418
MLAPAGAQAYDAQAVVREDGAQVFEVRFFGPQDGAFWFGDQLDTDLVATWQLDADQKTNILHAADYWASVIRPLPGGTVGVLNIGTYDESGAFGSSQPLSNGQTYKVPLQIALQGEALPAASLPYGAHGIFAMGTMDWLPGVNPWMPIGDQNGLNMAAVAVHEFAHTLGVSNSNFYASPTKPFFNEAFTAWAEHLVDDHGRPARPGQAILCALCSNTDPDGFDVRQDQGLFVGAHVQDALEGGLPGIPVKMLRQDVFGAYSLDTDTMSHLELKNSLMSHQKYRNYTRLMEAELAVMQDLGYHIDRRNFYGRSVYGSGLDIVNTRGYFARNAAGTAYLDQQANPTALGVGLHVYGSHNRIRQQADLLTSGAGATGIRVDGEANQLVVAPGVRVHAQGQNGQGVLLAYGRGHRLAVRGDVQALGSQGVGLRFDFGHNLGSGDAVEYRGSYIRTSTEGAIPLLPELDGALADQVDISGVVAGAGAALYMADNALVEQVNILRGARIQGDIVSDYAQRDAQGDLRLTTLSFGRQADADGWATDRADADFRFVYDGNIQGRDNLTLVFAGGQTRLDGHHQVRGAVIRPQAALGGLGQYDLAAAGTALLNQGVLAPGGADALGRITVWGDYIQAASGTLSARFDTQGQSDVLAVEGVASLQGALDLHALPGWYADGWLSAVQPLRADQVAGQFDAVRFAPVSPTLAFSALPDGPGQYRLGMTRAADAYGRYGADGNDRRVGQALAQLAARGPQAAQGLLASLDFSAADGSQVRRALPQLSAAGYNAALAASLRRDRLALDTAQAQVADVPDAQAAGWTGYAALFGGAGRQEAQDGLVASRDTLYGVVIGGSRRLDRAPDVRVGLSLDAAEQTVDLKAPWSGQAKATALGLGGQWRYQPDAWAGPYLSGGARLGVERSRLTRTLGFADYSARHEARWTGYQAAAQLAGGYLFALSGSVSAGPFAALDYARSQRPAVDESGPRASRLQLDSQHADTLRTRLGLTAQARWDQPDGSAWAAQARLSWDHDWLSRSVSQSARFAAQPAVSFDTDNALLPRNLLGLRAGLSWQRGDRLSIGLDLGGQTGGGYQAIDGRLTARWTF